MAVYVYIVCYIILFKTGILSKIFFIGSIMILFNAVFVVMHGQHTANLPQLIVPSIKRRKIRERIAILPKVPSNNTANPIIQNANIITPIITNPKIRKAGAKRIRIGIKQIIPIMRGRILIKPTIKINGIKIIDITIIKIIKIIIPIPTAIIAGIPKKMKNTINATINEATTNSIIGMKAIRIIPRRIKNPITKIGNSIILPIIPMIAIRAPSIICSLGCVIVPSTTSLLPRMLSIVTALLIPATHIRIDMATTIALSIENDPVNFSLNILSIFFIVFQV